MNSYSYDSCYEQSKQFQKVNLSSLKTWARPFIMAGTGAFITAKSFVALENQSYNPQIQFEYSISNKIDDRTTAAHVKNIQESFSLNTSELAAVLDVTRPTVYAWLEGSQEPKPEAVNHIRKISQVADKFRCLNISRIDSLIRRPIFNGRSLLDKLKANEEIVNDLFTLKILADKENQARKASKGSDKNIRSLSEAADDYSSPLYNKS